VLQLQPKQKFRVSQEGQPAQSVEAVAIMPLAIALARLQRVRGFQVPHAVDEAPEVDAAAAAWHSGRGTFGPLVIEVIQS